MLGHPPPRLPKSPHGPSFLAARAQLVGPVTVPGFAAEQEEDEPTAPWAWSGSRRSFRRVPRREELGHSYGEEDFECEGVGEA